MRVLPGAIEAAVVVVAVAAPAAAQDARFEAAMERGVTLREAGRDEEALAVFREAWEETHSPRARAQIGMAEHALGRWVEAHVHLNEALASRDPWVQRNRAALQRLLAAVERQFGSVEVRGRPAGAEVRINGARVGTLPMTEPVRVPGGAARLEVSAPGYDALVSELTVRPTGVTRETVQLAPRLAPAPPARGGALRALAWASAGTGAALLAGGAVALALHASTVDRHDARCTGAAAPGGPETPACRDDRELAGTLHTLSLTGLIAGGALGVASVVMFLVGPSRRESGASARVSCGAGPGSVGVSCGGTF